MQVKSRLPMILCILLLAAQDAHAANNTRATLDASLRALPQQRLDNGVVELPGIIYSVVTGYRPMRVDMYLPTRGKGPYPAVIFLHGGGWALDPGSGDYITGPSVMAQLAARGYVVARVTYRLSSEAKFPAQVTDAKTAIRWLRSNAKLYNIDPSRVAVWGTSAGGYIAAMVGTSCHEKSFETAADLPKGVVGLSTPTIDPATDSCVQAVVDWYGPIHFSTMDSQALPNSMFKHDGAQSSESLLLGCTLPQCSAELLKQANPLSYVDSQSSPFLIMHGTNDHGVPYQQSQELYGALRTNHVPAELKLIANADHMFDGLSKQQAQEQVQTVFAYLDQHLKAATGK
jgi:acetyl esterase/lipase